MRRWSRALRIATGTCVCVTTTKTMWLMVFRVWDLRSTLNPKVHDTIQDSKFRAQNLLPDWADDRELVHNVAQNVSPLHKLKDSCVKYSSRERLHGLCAHERLENVLVDAHRLDRRPNHLSKERF